MYRLFAAAWLALGSSAALAQSLPSFDFERLSLDPAARGSLVVGNGEVAPLYGLRLSLGAHWERDPLVLTDAGVLLGRGIDADDPRGSLVGDRLTLHFGAAATVLSFAEDAASVELSVRAPLVAWQDGDALPGFDKPSDAGFGRPSVGLKFAFLKQDKGALVSAAFATDVLIPPGTKDALAGETRATVVPRLEIGRRFGGFLMAAQAGGIIRPDKVRLASGETIGDEVTAGLALATTGKLRGELSFLGSSTVSNAESETQRLEILAGLRYAAFGQGEIFALGGPGFFEAPGTPTWRAVLGLAWSFGREPAPAAAAAQPEPQPDPCAPGQAHTPEQCPTNDDDGDGVANAEDGCPTERGLAELKGCPAKDGDGDGVADHVDECPAEAGLRELKGCPAKDGDGDGVADHLDKCPDVPGVAEQQGCEQAKAVLSETKIELKEAVYFDSGKATIKPVSFELLDDVAAILQRNPQVKKVVIEGHTDSTGAAEVNRRLSQARADAVKAYLVEKGVEAARLETAGFGPDRPIADNKTRAGRDKNRRVEFNVGEIAKPE
jgi:outer membrane protein OmpA-like peptidoglycan-associated protein